MNALYMSFSILLLTVTTSAAIPDWTLIAGDPGDGNSYRDHWLDSPRDRVVFSTDDGIRLFDLIAQSWVVREEPVSSFARTVIGHPSLPDRLIVGEYTGFWSGVIYLSEDLWQTYDLIYNVGMDGGVLDLEVDPTDTQRYFAACMASGVHRSLNGGLDWEPAGSTGEIVYEVEVGPDGVVYASGFGAVIRSLDQGATWEAIMSGLPTIDLFPELEADPSVPGHVLVAHGGYWDPDSPENGLYESFDGGVSWIKILDEKITSIDIHPDDSDLVAVCRWSDSSWNQGLSMDGGTTWLDWSGDLPPYSPGTMFFSTSDQKVYVYSSDRVWATSFDLTSTPTPSALESSLKAYPNPFNPRTKLRFRLSEPSSVNLTIHDPSGRLIATLLREERMGSGAHEREWRGYDDAGQRVASGVYLARIQASTEFSEVKLILLK